MEVAAVKHGPFHEALNEEQIVSAIRAAETQTSGQIRVFVSRHCVGDALLAAQRQFERLGMHHTRHRNGVLIFVAPRSQRFAIYGDTAIHEKCGDAFWQTLRDELVPHFQKGQYTQGLVHAIGKCGDLLAAHFPPDAAAANELPDAVAHD
jgi:uncharacterized membrane protein